MVLIPSLIPSPCVHAPTGIAMLKRAAQGAGAAGLAYAGYSFLKKPEEIDFAGESTAGSRAKIKRFNSLVNRGDNPSAMKTRAEQVKALKSGEQFDVIIIGGGCTGAGAALDATTRGLKTACTEPSNATPTPSSSPRPSPGRGRSCDPRPNQACIERGDFSNETSSRSSKLIWGGFKYLQVGQPWSGLGPGLGLGLGLGAASMTCRSPSPGPSHTANGSGPEAGPPIPRPPLDPNFTRAITLILTSPGPSP